MSDKGDNHNRGCDVRVGQMNRWKVGQLDNWLERVEVDGYQLAFVAADQFQVD